MKKKGKIKLYLSIVALLVCVQISCTTNSVKEPTSSVSAEKRKAIEKDFSPESFVDELAVFLRQNNIEAALHSFANIPDEHAENMSLRYIHASLLLSAGHTDEASKITTSLLSVEPDNMDVLNLAVLVAKAKNDTRKKNQVLEKILQKDPTNASANIEKANTQMLLKKYPLAKKHYLKALIGEPKNTEALFGYGKTNYFLNDLDSARSVFQQIVAIDPKHGMAWSYLGKLYAETEDYKKAIPCAEKAIEFQPDYYHHWIEIANYYRLTGKYEQAITALDAAIDIEPDYFLAYVYRAGIHDQEGHRKKALDDYLTLVKYKPDYYFAYEAIGILAWGEKNWSDTRTGFKKAYEVRPNNTSYPLMIAAAYLKEGKKKEAKEFLGHVMKNLDRSSIEYAITRLYWDGLGDSSVLIKVTKIDNSTNRGKFLFYMALWYELQGYTDLAQKYYLVIQEMECPMFFEYRLCEWALEEHTK
ncbi:MAG TPA: tetratricopeptide repeat protein [Treponemataceae bacterium]|nr:tetratricopeptide repeat protein [Treponemataceae bacterium]